jgi:hypothetical protein
MIEQGLGTVVDRGMSGRTVRALATKGHGSLTGSFRAGTGNNQWHPRSRPHVVPISHSLLVDAFIEFMPSVAILSQAPIKSNLFC